MSSLKNIGDRDFNNPIFVTGLARSGTSLTAGIFCLSGFWSGTISEYSVNNPKGFFEDRQLKISTTRRILKENKFDPMGQKPIPSHDKDLELNFDLRETVYDILKEQGYKGGPWLFKDAKLTFSWKHWYNAFPNADWVVTIRNPTKVINSCFRTRFMNKRKTASEWKEWVDIYLYKLALLRNSSANNYSIDTDKLAKRDFKEIKELFLELGVEFDEQKVSDFIVDGAMK